MDNDDDDDDSKGITKLYKKITKPLIRDLTYMVPPALREVWQLVFQCVLEYLKHDGDNPTQPPVSQQQCFQPPAEKMQWHK